MNGKDAREDDDAGVYRTILADPPWNERGAGKVKRGADRHYDVMKTEEIIEADGDPEQTTLAGGGE